MRCRSAHDVQNGLWGEDCAPPFRNSHHAWCPPMELALQNDFSQKTQFHINMLTKLKIRPKWKPIKDLICTNEPLRSLLPGSSLRSYKHVHLAQCAVPVHSIYAFFSFGCVPKRSPHSSYAIFVRVVENHHTHTTTHSGFRLSRGSLLRQYNARFISQFFH